MHPAGAAPLQNAVIHTVHRFSQDNKNTNTIRLNVRGIMLVMQYDVNSFPAREEEITAWLSAEYAQIQSGRITAALLDRVTVSAYGAKTALHHCAAIAVEDTKTITVTPYDETLLPEVETALQEQVPSVSVAVNDKTVRVITPELTGERRAMLEKTARERMEEAKKSIRGTREKILSDIKQKKADNTLSEDEEFTAKKKLQEKIDAANKKIEEMYEKKIQDIQA